MRTPGADNPTDVLVRARSVLIDALEALEAQRNAVIVIGAQAVYLHTGAIEVALAETTKDSDVALDPRMLGDHPLVEAAMKTAGFFPSTNGQPGSWVSVAGIPVDLMVPEALAGGGGRNARGARVPPHDKAAMRRARGLEAVVVDNGEMEVRALDPADGRVVRARVAGPAALLVAKVHKIWERVETPGRLNDKDAHDAYRILRAVDTAGLCSVMRELSQDAVSGEATREAIEHLAELFGSPSALGSQMAGRAEEGVGEPEVVATAVSILASDLLECLRGS